MKLLVAILLTALLALVGGMWLPWWSIAIASLLIGLLVPQRAGRAFLAGFLGIFLLWAIYSLSKDIPNDGLLSAKVADMFSLGRNSILIILVTAFVGGLVGGFGGMTGSFLRSSR